MILRAKRIGRGTAVLLALMMGALLSMMRVSLDAPPPAVGGPADGGRLSAQGTIDEDTEPLVIPVEGARVAELRDSWGQARGNGARVHHAIDIMAPLGTPVLAAASGTVEKIFESVNGGHTLYVRTRDGRTIHYYAHLESYLVRERQPVRQGDRIATVGNTGSAAGGAPHLHFEIKRMQPGEGWWQGENINPYPLLKDVRD